MVSDGVTVVDYKMLFFCKGDELVGNNPCCLVKTQVVGLSVSV